MTAAKHGLVLAGGGAYGSYELGVLKALFQGRTMAGHGSRVTPAVMTGASIGSFNAAFLASRWDHAGLGAVHELEDLWLRRLAERGGRNGAFRIRLNPFDLMNFPSLFEPIKTARRVMGDAVYLGMLGAERTTDLFNTTRPLPERVMGLFNLSDFVAVDPWVKTLESTINYHHLATSKVALRITATNWENGELTVFENRHMTPREGPRVIRASSALPGIFPVAVVGARRFVDGAVLSNTPLKPAIRAGADVLHVINLYAGLKQVPLADPANTLETLYRQQLIEWAAMLRRDLDRVRTYNREFCGSDRTHGNGEPYRRLTVHVHAPAESLGGPLDLLNLEPARIKHLIELGFNDGEGHDCAAMGCIGAAD